MSTTDLHTDGETSLNTDALRRLVTSLISEVQQSLAAQGAINPRHSIVSQSATRSAEEIDSIRIDEPSLGIDSLARLELIIKVNKVFSTHLTGIDDYLLLQPTIGEWVRLLVRHLQLANADLPITFSTSGSTGTPVDTRHSMSDLLAEVRALREMVFSDWPKHGRLFSLVPPHHIYGFLFSCLLPSQAKREVVDLSRQNPFSVVGHAQSGDLVIATPYLWKQLVETGREFVDGVQGVTSGGPSDDVVWRATSQLKLTKLSEIYGATETAGIGIRCSQNTAFRVLPHLGVKSEEIYRPLSETPLTIQDELAWVSDCEFKVVGRRDKVVQVAGVNVCPSFVAKQIEALPMVSAAAVRLNGDRLKAFVVLQEPSLDRTSAREAIFSQALKKLPPPARPATITIGGSLPINAQGKAADWVPTL